MLKGHGSAKPILDTNPVRRISAYLVEGEFDVSPMRLSENAGKSHIGSVLLGMGFTFDDTNAEKGTSSSLADMERVLDSAGKSVERIFPFIGGEEVNNEPSQAHHRYVFNLSDLSESEAQGRYPNLYDIALHRVRPQRSSVKRDTYRTNWWKFAEPQSALYRAIETLPRVLATNCGASPHLCFAFLPKGIVYAHTLTVIAYSSFAAFCVLQSRVHEVWAKFFSSTLEDRLRYTPSDCFRTFPFTADFDFQCDLEKSGEAYYSFRADLMVRRSQGLTKTYNRFHARAERNPEIIKLRNLHNEMDAAVLRAYGWTDLLPRATPEFVEQDFDEGKKPKTRLDWTALLKDEVLARLLTLNIDRAAAEAAAGLLPPPEPDDDIIAVEQGEEAEEDKEEDAT